MYIVDHKSKLWSYLPDELRGLITDGENLLVDCQKNPNSKVSDYSYLVFPFSKAYEGFLKNIFLDMGLIREEDFYGDHTRIGRILNPMFMEKGDSVYSKLLTHSPAGRAAAEKLWRIWKRGRNEIFHYFPHNFRRIGREEAVDIIAEMVAAMELAVRILDK